MPYILTGYRLCSDRSAYATVFFKKSTYASNVLLRDIEDRIARLTMIRRVSCGQAEAWKYKQ